MASSGKTTKKRPQATVPTPSMRTQAKEAFAEQLHEHIDDVVVVACGLIGIISTLAIFTDSVGVVGSFLREIAAYLFGQARIIFLSVFLLLQDSLSGMVEPIDMTKTKKLMKSLRMKKKKLKSSLSAWPVE